MNYHLIISPFARTEIKNAVNWYNKQQTKLGYRFKKHLLLKVSVVRNNPNTFQVKYKDIRTAKVDGFPFLIHYHFNETEKLIIIFAVYHTSRKPKG